MSNDYKSEAGLSAGLSERHRAGRPVNPQQPIGSGLSSRATAADVIQGVSLNGRTAIVTGGYSGLGLEAVGVLAAAGARVIVPARDVSRAAAALNSVRGVEIAPLDLLDPTSIDLFAERFVAREQPLHFLVNSAAIMANPLARDRRGFEQQFSTNHLGHFQLTARLWPALCRADGARVVSVASRGHWFSAFNFDDPNFQRRDYDPWLAYGQSKTANILFAVELDQRGRERNVRAFSVHPGSIVATGLAKHLSQELLQSAGAVDEHGKVVIDPENGLKTPQQGASTIVWCATSPQLGGVGGVYCEDNDISTINDDEPRHAMPTSATVSRKGVKPYAIDPDNARGLWSLSEELLGMPTPF